MLGPGEWWASELARHLGMDPKTLGQWILRGWVAARRQGEGVGSCWIVRAGREEQARMRRLRRWLREHDRRSPPEKLTRPSPGRQPEA